MAKPTTVTKAEAQAAVEAHPSRRAAALSLGIHHSTLARILGNVKAKNPQRVGVSPEDAKRAFLECGGVKAETARRLGIHTETLRKLLAETDIEDKPLAAGRLGYITANELPMPTDKTVRYLLTSAQNNTPVHKQFWSNLLAYSEHLGARLMVSRFTYNKASYASAKSVKPGRGPNDDDLRECWYDNAILPFICDEPDEHGYGRWRLAPGLVFAAEMNILPTASRPLSGLKAYTGRDSSIFPHSKQELESVESGPSEAAKFMYTTGCCTQRNYIQKKAGLKAESHHAYGFAIVEVKPNGSWYVRQIEANLDGSFYDVPSTNKLCTLVHKGAVTDGHRAEGINWGDVHAVEADPDVVELNWGKGGILDSIQARNQLMHDILSFRSRSHHEQKSFDRMFEKWLEGTDSVETEVSETARLMHTAHRAWCNQLVVSSNHDRHGERWLNEADYRQDLLNAEFFLEAQLERVRAMRERRAWTFAEWGLRRAECPPTARFLGQDESFILCPGINGGVECGMHGDEGANGARGSTMGYTRLARRINKGHDHRAAKMDHVMSAGACARWFPYMSGPGGQSVSHIITMPDSGRFIITLWNGDWRG